MCSRYFPQPALIAFFLFSCGAVCHNCLKMCFSMFLLDHIVLGCALKLDYDCKQNMSSMPKRSIPQTTGVQHHSPLKPLLNGNLNSFLRMEVFQFVAKYRPVRWEVTGSTAIFNKDEPQVLPRARRVATAGGPPFSYAPALK